MSIKIYAGLRVKIKHLSAAQQYLYRLFFNEAVKQYGELMGSVSDEFIKAELEKGKYKEERWVRHNSVKALFEAHNDVIDYMLTCGFNMWYYKGYFYIVPYGRRYTGLIYDHKFPDYIESYPYWNQTDKPEELTHAQWRKRERDWKFVIDDYSMRYRLAYPVIHNDPHYCYDLFKAYEQLQYPEKDEITILAESILGTERVKELTNDGKS